MYERDTYADKVDLAKGILIGLAANFEAPHYKPREMASKALDLAGAFYDELDAREVAAEAKDSAAGPTEPPASPLQTSDVQPDEIDEDPEPERQPNQIVREVQPEPIRPWTGGDLARA